MSETVSSTPALSATTKAALRDALSAEIEAALAPSTDDDLYFVHQGDGHHVFSRTYDEHRIAVREARGRRNR